MVAVIAHTAVKKTVVSSKHTVFLAFIIIGNIAIWLVKNMIYSSFEFLSISYIVTESTIKKHTAAIYRKLETANRAELFEKAKEYI